jgi:Domain of unknown function (DUF4168)
MDRRFIASIAAAAALALSSGAFAQQAPQASPQASSQVSDTDLEQFANIYVDLRQTASKYEAQMANVRTEDEARDVQAKLQEESLATVAEHGWTADKYNSVAQAINADPELAQKTLELIDDRSPLSGEQ